MPTISDAAIAAAARQAGFPESELATAVAVALAESGGNTTATHQNLNGTVDHGLWQINSVHASLLAGGDWRDPNANARMAYSVWRERGGSWSPWYTYPVKSGLYLPRAKRAVGSQQPSTQDARWPLPFPRNPSVPDLPNLMPDVPNPFAGFNDLVAPIGKGVSILTSAEFWKRVGVFWLGFLLVLWGAMLIILQSRTLKSSVSSAKTVATKWLSK